MRLRLATLLLVALPSLALAREFFVSPTGDDGTSERGTSPEGR